MAKYQLLTRPAADAIHWVMNGLPEAGFADFQREMEIVMARTMQRYGVTEEVLKSFGVTHFIADRDPVTSAVFGTQYRTYGGDTFLIPDDEAAPVLKLHDDGLWYPAAAHHTRRSVAASGHPESPARATRFGDPTKGEKTPKIIYLMGDLYRHGKTGVEYAICAWNWYEQKEDGLWHKMDKALSAAERRHITKEGSNIKFAVRNEFYTQEQESK